MALAFTAFCARLGVTLEPGQLVLAKVAFDGVEPRDLEGQERELARQIYGPDVETIPALARSVVVVVAGARSGKSYLFALRALHLALTVPLTTIAPGQRPSVTITAPNQSLALEDINYVRGALLGNPALRGLVVGGCEEESKSLDLTIRRTETLASGKKRNVLINIAARAAGAKGSNQRGRSLPCGVLDECAFFQDEDHKVSDVDLFGALEPRVMLGGQTLVGSTPWAETGLLWGLFDANWNRPTTCLVAHAPTRVMRNKPEILAQVERGELRDPENAAREFGAKFLKTEARQFFDAEALSLAFVDDLLPRDERADCEVAFGGDFGFTRNSSALAGGDITPEGCDVRHLLELKPAPGAPLKPSEVFASFGKAITEAGGDSIMVDGHYVESAREDLGSEGVSILDAPTDKSALFVEARRKMREGRVRIPRSHPLAERLRQQLRSYKAKPLAGGGLSVSAPQATDGSHADVASALINLIVQDHGAESRGVRPPPGTAAAALAAERESEERHRRRVDQQASRQWWREGTSDDGQSMYD